MPTALTHARIFDGRHWHDDHALIVEKGRIAAIAPLGRIPPDSRIINAAGTLLVPGFVDMQVNGGGGVLLNDNPSVQTIQTICQTHARFGTTALFPTLITDHPLTVTRALKAAVEAKNVAGFAGLHLEGPHLSQARKGAHDGGLIRPMNDDDAHELCTHAPLIGRLMVTVAPESTTLDQVRTLTRAGVLVALGHSDASYDAALAYMQAGAKMVTHLFNAMSGLTSRAPGLAGAALADGAVHAGLIADGFHVHPAMMKIAIRAKNGGDGGKIFLVSDAMSPIGTRQTEFALNGRTILRQGGRLTLADGTLAGADIDMLSSVRLLHHRLHLPLDEALRMAGLYPAQAAGLAHKGQLQAGSDADFIILTPDLALHSTWIGGERVYKTPEHE